MALWCNQDSRLRFCFNSLSYWSIAPSSQPIRRKTKTNHDVVVRVFPHFLHFASFYFEFSLVNDEMNHRQLWHVFCRLSFQRCLGCRWSSWLKCSVSWNNWLYRGCISTSVCFYSHWLVQTNLVAEIKVPPY